MGVRNPFLQGFHFPFFSPSLGPKVIFLDEANSLVAVEAEYDPDQKGGGGDMKRPKKLYREQVPPKIMFSFIRRKENVHTDFTSLRN